MKIVIEISNLTYQYVKKNMRTSDVAEALFTATQNATPLPKRHGRLIDEDILRDRLRDSYLDSFGLMRVEKVLKNIDATIEEDKEDE